MGAILLCCVLWCPRLFGFDKSVREYQSLVAAGAAYLPEAPVMRTGVWFTASFVFTELIVVIFPAAARQWILCVKAN